MTEVDLNSSSAEPFGIQPRPGDSSVFRNLSGTKKSLSSPATDRHGHSVDLTADSHQSQYQGTSSPVPVSSNLKKQAELYMSCFVQKLPQVCFSISLSSEFM